MTEPIYFVTCARGHTYKAKIVTEFASNILSIVVPAKYLFGFIPISPPQLLKPKAHYLCRECGAQLVSEEGIVDGKQVMGSIMMPKYYNKETKELFKLIKKRKRERK